MQSANYEVHFVIFSFPLLLILSWIEIFFLALYSHPEQHKTTGKIIVLYTECNRIIYSNLKIYCDQTNSNITTQFLTEHLLTLQDFLRVFNMAASGYAADI
jgi:hypothetical protein